MIIYEKMEFEYLNSNITLRELCKKYSKDRFTFSNYLKSKGINTKRKQSTNESLFEIIDNEEKAYWLGFLYADGCIIYNENEKRYVVELTLCEKDYLHVQKFKNFLKCNNKITYKEKQKAYKICINSKKICSDLIKLGCIPKKSLILTFPTEKQVPLKLQKHFVRGYFDGDGCISLSNRSKAFQITILGTLNFLNSIENLHWKLKLVYSKDKRHLNDTWTLRFRTKEALEFINYIYNNSTIYLIRKFEKYNIILNCRSVEKSSELLESKNGED